MTRYGMAINLTRCTGCETCILACKMQNNVPMGINWNRIENDGAQRPDGCTGTYPNVARNIMTVACQHCDNPTCVSVCPTGATYVDDEKRVQIDYSQCIGCKSCILACPYDVRSFNESEPVRDPDFNYGDKDVVARGQGVVEKCTFCKERTDRGEEPMCVVCCPMKARVFGDLDDPNSEISQYLNSHDSFVLHEEEGTSPKVHYVR